MVRVKFDRNAMKKLEKQTQREVDKRTGGKIEVGPTVADTERNLKKAHEQLGGKPSASEIRKQAKKIHKDNRI